MQLYLDENKFLDMLGQLRRDQLDDRDLKRQQRQINVEHFKELQQKKGKVQDAIVEGSPSIIDGNQELQLDEEFVEIGGRREDYADMAMRMEDKNRSSSFN